MEEQNRATIVTSEADAYITEVCKKLEQSGYQTSCISYADFAADNQALLLLDYRHDPTECNSVLQRLESENRLKSVATFVVTEELTPKLQEELFGIGVADILSVEEGVGVSLLKIEKVLGKAQLSTDIDLTSAAAPEADGTVRVLVIEDDNLLRNLLDTKFEQSHINARFSIDGADIEETIVEYMPTVLLLDIMLPGVNGLDLLEEIRKTEAGKDIPVIIFSNRDEQNDRRRAEDLGAKKYFVKAMTDLSRLVSVIEEVSK